MIIAKTDGMENDARTERISILEKENEQLKGLLKLNLQKSLRRTTWEKVVVIIDLNKGKPVIEIERGAKP